MATAAARSPPRSNPRTPRACGGVQTASSTACCTRLAACRRRTQPAVALAARAEAHAAAPRAPRETRSPCAALPQRCARSPRAPPPREPPAAAPPRVPFARRAGPLPSTRRHAAACR
eukprot:5099338-Prymnesium_polylepis.1